MLEVLQGLGGMQDGTEAAVHFLFASPSALRRQSWPDLEYVVRVDRMLLLRWLESADDGPYVPWSGTDDPAALTPPKVRDLRGELLREFRMQAALSLTPVAQSNGQGPAASGATLAR